jgi:hypothetical protein
LYEEAMSSPSARSVVDDAAWFPVDLDRPRSELLFARVDENILRRQSFLTSENWNIDSLPFCRLDVQAVLEETERRAEASMPVPLNFIWHTGYCCSTLISRALDLPGRSLSLREPHVTTRMVDMKRDGTLQLNAMSDRLPAMMFRLLARPLRQGMQMTLKPSNSTNFLMPEAAKATSGRHLFLFSDCRSFLTALVRRGQQGMKYGRTLFLGIAGDGNEQNQWPMQDLFAMTDLQIAAVAWHMEIAQFNRAWPLLGDRAMSLDCDAFLQTPAPTLARLTQFLDLGFGEGDVIEVVNGPLLRSNAKNPDAAYSIEQRRLDQVSISEELSLQVTDAVAWSYGVCKATPSSYPLPSPLVEIDKTYQS